MSDAEDFAAIGNEGGVEALAMVASFMDYNARCQENLLASLYEGEVEAHKRTRERLARAEAHIWAIEKRMMAILAPPSNYEFEGEA